MMVTSMINAAPLPAQSSGSIFGLRPGATVRVKTAGQTLDGKISQIRRDSMWISSSSSRIGVVLRSVDSAWTLERQIRTGAAIGGISGAVLFGTLYGLAGHGLCDTAKCPVSDAVGLGVIGGLMGGAAGAMLGGTAGSFVKRWKRRLP